MIRETTGTMNEVKARGMLRLSEGDVERGIPISPKKDRITFEEGVEHPTADCQVMRRKSQDQLERRIRSGSDLVDAARLLDQKSGHPLGTLGRRSRPKWREWRIVIVRFLGKKLEAPSGFEPEMEVLQLGARRENPPEFATLLRNS